MKTKSNGRSDPPEILERLPGGSGSRAQGGALSPQAFEAYLIEYKECMEGYRHAVSTVWRAGTVVAAISAGLFAFGFSGEPGMGDGMASIIRVVALIPLIVWCFGLYWPLNHYAELKCDRLVEIEQLLSDAVPDLEMRHFRQYRENRRGDQELHSFLRSLWHRIRSGKIFPPRIVEVVAFCGLGLVAVEAVIVLDTYVLA